METIDLFSIIAIAFLGSFGHCIGMCGGIVIAYSSTKVSSSWSKAWQSFAHILYSFGRITTYVTLGVLFGYLGGVATLTNTTNGILLLIAGLTMVLVGVSLGGQLKFLTVIEHSVSGATWYQSIFRAQLDKQSLLSFYILGLLNGLLPCGFVYFFAITAASTASPLWGGVVMFVFGLSTIPALFSLGFFVGILKKTEFRGVLIKLAAISVVLYGVYTIYNGYEYITIPEKTVQQCHTE